MKITNTLTIIIVLILQYSAACQDKICLERDVAVRIASKLDSFDVLKKTQFYYLDYIDTCEILTQRQADIIKDQAFIITNNEKTIDLLNEKYNDCESVVKINELLIKDKNKQIKKTKRSLTFSLVGGGVVAISLTTAILAILL
jgi:hypothetical protein